jgi:uncharacterized RDD family membrane protein YckC
MMERTQIHVLPQAQPVAAVLPAAQFAPRPALWRRVLAGALDRCLPLPLLAFFFPAWTLVVVAYHLLCDSAPERRSVGKWACRLRVVASDPARKCAWWQAALRHVGVALTQAAWCSWEFIPFVLAYELIVFACVLLSKEGKRPEDWLAGTRVVTEKAYRQWRQR